MVVVVILAGVFGTLIGSFLNVVVYRVPRKLSLVHPGSACPSCGHPIRAIDNIPILSWLLLRGHCRDCGAGISARYPLVELLTAFAFIPVAIIFLPSATSAPGLVADVLVLIAFLGMTAVTVALAIIDIETQTLPNRIVLPSLAVLALFLLVAGLLRGDADALLRGVIGMVGLFLLYLALALIGGMGFGDVKLAALLGLATAWVGWPALGVGAFAAFALGAVFGLLLLIARRAGRKTAIPFGPWMLLGAWIGIFFGDAVWRSYAAFIGVVQ